MCASLWDTGSLTERKYPSSEESETKRPTIVHSFGDYWRRLPQDVQGYILGILQSDPRALINLCRTSKEMYQLCRKIQVVDSTNRRNPIRKTVWEYILGFSDERDVKKCLLYRWVNLLLLTDESHYRNFAEAFPPEVLEYGFETRKQDLQEGHIELLSDRWFAHPLATSVLQIIPYEKVSRNDLLFFASAYPSIYSNPIFAEIHSVDPTESRLPLLWYELNDVDRAGAFGLPQNIHIVTDRKRSLESDEYLLGTSAEDLEVNRVADTPVFAFPLYGTDTRVRELEYLYTLTAPAWFKMVLPRMDVNALPSDKLYEILIGEGMRKSMEKLTNDLIRHYAEKSGIRECEGDANFFDVFDVALYVIPEWDPSSGWNLMVVGTVIVRPDDISPVGVNYWN
jgi:hypothetical protein